MTATPDEADRQDLFQGDCLSVTVAGDTAELSLNRPELLNRFDRDAHGEFVVALDRLHRCPHLRVALIRSTGDVFSAGGDFDYILKMQADPAVFQDDLDEGRHLLQRLMDVPFPVVAAVGGHAIGLGATIAFACDVVVTTPAVKFGDPHVQLGLVAADGGCLVWPLGAGLARAKRHLLTGDTLSGQQAYDWGLVTDLVDDPDQVLPTARRLAAHIAALPPLGVQGTKRTLNNMAAARANEVYELAWAYQMRAVISDDVAEAIDATKRRRPGIYRGL